MIVEFKDEDVWKLCNNERALNKALGADNISLRQIQKKLDALKAFTNLGDVPKVPPYRLHSLHREYVGKYAVDINGKYRIIINPKWPSGIAKSDENLKHIAEIVIEEVINYHG